MAAMAAIEKICPEARNLLVVPENHTRNTFYLSNVVQLKRIFHQTGLNVRFGSLSPEIKEPTTYDLPTGESITIEPLIRSERKAGSEGFRSLHHLAQQRPVRPVSPASWKICTSSICCRPCTQAGRCGANRGTFRPTRKCCKRFAKLLGIDPLADQPHVHQMR